MRSKEGGAGNEMLHKTHQMIYKPDSVIERYSSGFAVTEQIHATYPGIHAEHMLQSSRETLKKSECTST